VDDGADPGRTRAEVAAIIATKTADEWAERFAGKDVCVSIVKSLQEAVKHPHFRSRGLFDELIESGDGTFIPALPLPIIQAFRQTGVKGIPQLGEDNAELL
jgi:crotonobetainyl-CoA:carnitine CoA-transferase CaiB-like acyl-CoA transferase